MQIYYQKFPSGSCRWTWKEAFAVKVFGAARTLASMKRRAARLFTTETNLEFIPFETVEGALVPLSAIEPTDQSGRDAA